MRAVPGRAASQAGARAAARGFATPAAAAACAAALAIILAASFAVPALSVLASSAAAASEASDWGMEGLDSNERAIARFLKSKGLDRLHAAAIMGNMAQESGCRPDAEQNPGGPGGIGLCQWGHLVDGGRGDLMAAWAASQGRSWDDISVQLDWVWAEMCDEGPAAGQTSWYSPFTSPASMSSFLSETTLQGAVSNWQLWIEAAGDVRLPQRVSYAQRYLMAFQAGSSGEAVEAAIEEGLRYLGMDYVFGGSTPQTGFDCSGFVKWCFEAAGIDLAGIRTAQQIYDAAEHIEAAEAVRGDIVCFTYGAPNAGEVMGHIGIYLGDGTMLHCGGEPGRVQISPVGSGYYGRL